MARRKTVAPTIPERKYQPPDPASIHPTTIGELLKGRRSLIKHGNQSLDPSFISETRSLWLSGKMELVQSPCVAVVGTRDVSEDGARRARRLGRELAQRGVVVVSGLAKGVDTEAFRSAIEYGGQVIAVIGTPLDKAYPAEKCATTGTHRQRPSINLTV